MINTQETKTMNYHEQRYQKTHLLIRETFEKLILAYPFQDVTVTLLCMEAGINRKTFYLHYESMSSLMEELIEDMVSEIRSFLSKVEAGISGPVVKGQLEGFFSVLSKRQVLHQRLICSPDYLFAFHQISDRLADLNAGHTQVSGLPDDFRQQVVTRFLTSSVMPIYRDWLVAGKPISEKELAKLVEELMLHGLNSIVKMSD